MKPSVMPLLALAALLAADGATAQEYKAPLAQIKLGAATHASVDGSGVTVAIFDGLADANHPEFAGRLDGIGYDTGTYTRWDRHGTHVAGIVGAAADGQGMVGVAPGASLLNVAVFDDDGWTADGSAYNALVYAAQQGATIVNMSYGPTAKGDVFLAGELAAIKGFGGDLMIARAAGNTGVYALNESFVGNPQSDLDHLLIVGSVDANNRISSFSNKPGNACFLVNGKCAEKNKLRYYWIVAPGRSITSTLPDGGYGAMSGTSMAAPHVAGAAALLQEKWPHLKDDPAKTASILKTTATDLGAKGPDGVFGYGLLNVTKALQPVGGTTVATGGTVGSGQGTTTSRVTVGAGLMDQRGIERAFANLVVFDAYGRDFRAGLALSGPPDDGEAMLDRLGALGLALQQGAAAPLRLGDLTLAFTAGAGLDGAVLNQMEVTQRGLGLTLGWGAPLGQAALLLSPASDAPRALLRREMGLGLGSLAQELEHMSFAGGSLDLGGGLSLAAFHAVDAAPGASDTAAALGQEEAGSVTLTGARLGVALADDLVLGLSWQRIGEEDQVLGGESSGAFAMAETARTDLVGLSLAWDLADDVSLFAFWQEGWSQTDAGGDSLFADAEGWRSRRFGLTLGLAEAFLPGDRLEVSLVRPLTVTQGDGSARVPVGRTLEGQVIYEAADFSVASEATPLELGLTWLGARGEWAPGRPLAYGVALGWATDDLGREAGDASLLFALQAKF